MTIFIQNARYALRNTKAAIDLASVMVGVIVIGILGGIIAATIFAIIPWAYDNAAKAQLAEITTAQSAYAGLAADRGDFSKYGDLTDGSSDIPSQKLMAASTDGSYCAVASGENFYAYSVSKTGKTFTLNGRDTTPTVLDGAIPCLPAAEEKCAATNATSGASFFARTAAQEENSAYLTQTGSYFVDGSVNVGSDIFFNYSVANYGSGDSVTSITLTNEPSTPVITSFPGAEGELMVGERATVRGIYTITQADVDTGVVKLTLTSTGIVNGVPQSSSTELVVPTVAERAALNMAVAAENTEVSCGETVLISGSLTNTGNVSVSEISIENPYLSNIVLQYPGDEGQLLPGETVRFTASYTVTPADEKAGTVSLSTDAFGKTAQGSELNETKLVELTVAGAPNNA